jgi:hypothetical protein
MALIPPSFRPTTFLRRRVLRRGMRSKNDVVRLLALIMIGRPALVRHTAFTEGLAGRDRFWRVVAFGFLAQDVIRKFTVKEPERLGIERLVPGQSVTVTALPASARRSRRAS